MKYRDGLEGGPVLLSRQGQADISRNLGRPPFSASLYRAREKARGIHTTLLTANF